MKKINQAGFSHLAIPLVVIVIAALVGVGWYVWDKNKNEEPASSNTQPVAQTDTEHEQADETSEWSELKSVNGVFSLRIPDGWEIYNGRERDYVDGLGDMLVYKKGTPAVILEEDSPGRDGGGGFFIHKVEDKTQGWTDSSATKTSFGPIDGVMAEKYTQTHGKPDEEAGLGPQEGEISYEYFVVKDGKTYRIAYSVLPSQTNQIEVVEKAIKTLKFH